jgi:ADP-ribosyltransferase exoenzyme
MKTLKQYRADKQNQPYPVMDTCFGSHSISNQPYPEMGTEFGSHSVAESVENVNPFLNSRAREREIHEDVAPLDDEKLSNKELGAVMNYTDSSLALNKMLHDKSHDKPKLVDWANNLSSALSKHKIASDIHTFTGVSRSPARFFNSPEQGTATVHLPAFTSTTTNFRTANRFTKPRVHPSDVNHDIPENEEVKHILRLHMPAGTHAASMFEHSQHNHENEILMNRGADIEINRTPVDVGNNTFMWHAKVVGQNPQPLS